MRIAVIEIRRDHNLYKPVKMIALKEFDTEEEAYKHLAKFSENQFISPSCGAANNVYRKWLREDYSESPYNRDSLWAHGMFNIWLYQVFMCKINDFGITYVYDRDFALEHAAAFRKKEEKKLYEACCRWCPEPPQSMRGIPLKKKKYHKPRLWHNAANTKIRAMDYPDEIFEYEGEVYSVDVQHSVSDRWDCKYTFKFWHHADHVCWKNNKKNKKQWMKNAS